jgi:hypothetical protein
MPTIRFSHISKSHQALIRLCQRVNYGSIQNLNVVDGSVRFESPPDIIVEVKLDGDVSKRDELDLADFLLPDESCRLLDQIRSLKNGVIEKIVVHEGLPRRVVLRAPLTEVHP